MSVTTFGITLWLWKKHKPNNILGKKENRLLLLVRAFGGFLGVLGLYCMSLPCVLVLICDTVGIISQRQCRLFEITQPK